MITLSQNVGNTSGIHWPYAIHTLAIRQLYASCMLNTLLNRQAYAKMSIYVADTLQIRCRYVRHTSEVCYSFAINTQKSFFKARLGSESVSDVNGRCQNNSTCQFCNAIIRWFIDELQHPSQELLQVLFCCFLTCKEILTKIIPKDEKSLHFLFKHPFCVKTLTFQPPIAHIPPTKFG